METTQIKAELPLILISAMTRNRVIGSGQGMPWSVPEEYQHYLGLIKNETVIMGRRSYEIFGSDLTSAHTVVVSRSVQTLPDAVVCGQVEEALATARTLGRTIFCAGGATLYRQMLPLANRLYLSYIKAKFEGDTYFPVFDASAWHVTRRDDHDAFEFVVYERK